LFEVAHVRNNRESLAHVWIRSAGIVDGLGCRLEVLELSAHQDNICARFSERSRDTACNARATASDECDASMENFIYEDLIIHKFFWPPEWSAGIPACIRIGGGLFSLKGELDYTNQQSTHEIVRGAIQTPAGRMPALLPTRNKRS
jgi:hypothetical protein